MKITLKMFKQAVKNGLRVLHLDCETSPMLVYTHYISSKTSLTHKQIKEDSKVICVQYKWEDTKEARYLEWDSIGNFKYDDSLMLEELGHLIEQADIIVGQNIDQFDMKVLQGRMAELGLTPLNYDLTIDILKLSRKSFRFASQKLDYRSQKYGTRGKDKMEFQDWVDVTEGKVPVSKKMGPYGCQDVEIAQKTFYKEFDYYKSLPSKVEKKILEFLKEDRPECTRCGLGHRAKYNIKKELNKKTLKEEYVCNNCDLRWSAKRTKK